MLIFWEDIDSHLYIMRDKCHSCISCIADKTRFQIFNMLVNKEEASVSEISRKLHLKQPTITFHLKKMEKMGLIKKQRQGQNVFSVLNIHCSDCPLIK